MPPWRCSVLQAACEGKSTDCVEYLIDEIVDARKMSAHPDSLHSGQSLNAKEFLSHTILRQAVFFELGSELVSINGRPATRDCLEKSPLGWMLANTPRAFVHLLNSCIYTEPGRGGSTFVDLFPFYNNSGVGSELNLLRVIIHFNKFDLLTHPLCELFLHLKWLRARWIYWAVTVHNLIFSGLAVSLVLIDYGHLEDYFDGKDFLGLEPTHKNSSLPCSSSTKAASGYLRLMALILSALTALVLMLKALQDRTNIRLWQHRPEALLQILVIILVWIDHFFCFGVNYHKLMGSLIVWSCCRIMMYTVARDPDIAIFVEMMASIQKGLVKFSIGFIWLFIGWIIIFHVTLGSDKNSVFRDLGSATAKVISMFSGELGYETSIRHFTSWKSNGETGVWVLIIYSVFIVEMVIILVNLVVGVSISDIQDLRQNADALRMVKEVILQRYLESFLTLITCHKGGSLGRLVSDDLYQGDSVFRLDGLSAFESGNCVSLELLSKGTKKREKKEEVEEEESCSAYSQRRRRTKVLVPRTVVAKLEALLKGKELLRREQHCIDQGDIKKLIMDIKKDLEVVKAKLLSTSSSNISLPSEHK